MRNRTLQASLLLLTSLVPVSLSAGTVDLSDVRITARATFSSQRVPEKSDFDVKVAPPDQLLQAAQALVIDGLPFPNVPNSQNAGFASSAGVVGGVFGVGVNGMHFENSLPPNRYFASGTWTQTLVNNSAVTQVSSGTISVPEPTMRFFGIGNSFPAGRDPDLDAAASVNIRLFSILTRANGTTQETVHFEYGMHTFRDTIGGAFLVNPTNDALGALSRFDEPDGSFGFRLLPVVRTFSFSSVAPGESLQFGYDYFALASTGFGETAVFAAIGDPFNLSSTGSGFEFHVQPAIPSNSTPEPGSLVTYSMGLLVLGIFAYCRRTIRLPRATKPAPSEV